MTIYRECKSCKKPHRSIKYDTCKNCTPRGGVCSKCGKNGSFNSVKDKLCLKCYGEEYYKINKEKICKRTNDNSKRKTREVRGLPHDHPRLLALPGDGHLTKDGYRVITKVGHPNATPYRISKRKNGAIHTYGGRIAEHTWVMSQHLGRPLTKFESVHHKNGIRSDNRLENLELWHRGQPAGQRLDDKLKWASEFLEEYGYKVTR